MKGEPVSNKYLIGQIAFSLFLLLEMSQGGKKCRRRGSKYPEAKSKLEQIHIKNLSVPKVSACKSTLLGTETQILKDVS